MANERITDRAAWYDKTADLPADKETKIKVTKQQSGALSDGYEKLKVPEDKTAKPLTLASTRDSVGSKWPGPGKQLHGKASPTSPGDCLCVAPNRELKAK